MGTDTLLNFGKRYEDNLMGHFLSVAKVALRFGCAKQSKNFKRYLVITYLILHINRLAYNLVYLWLLSLSMYAILGILRSVNSLKEEKLA